MVVKRKHTWINVAPAIKTLRSQINTAYPDRLKNPQGTDSDGIWPSAAHTKRSPNSDHEGGNAFDIDDDLSGKDGVAPMVTPVLAAVISKDPRVNYVIHDRRIYRNGRSSAYTSSNPHSSHAHVSVYESKRNDASKFKLGVATAKPTPKRMWWVSALINRAKHLRGLTWQVQQLSLKLMGRSGDPNLELTDAHIGTQAKLNQYLGNLAKMGIDNVIFADEDDVVVWLNDGNNTIHMINGEFE